MMKLLKYELKQTWRMGVTLLGGTLLGCLGLMFNPFSSSSVMFFLQNIFFTIIVTGSLLALFLHCMLSFNQDFIRPQGYLMMTLPIKARQFIWAKFIGQLIWNMSSIIILTFSIPLIISHRVGGNININTLGIPRASHIFSNGLSSYILIVFIVYFSIVVQSMQPRNSHNNFAKIMLAILLINVINILVAIASISVMGLSLAVKYGIPTGGPEIIRFADYIQNNMQGLNMVNIIINILVAGIFYLMTKNIIDNKVQL